MLDKHLDKNNLHHAYLLEGEREQLLAEVLKSLNAFKNCETIEIKTDTFKIEDSRNLKSMSAEKSFSSGKKIFIISANSILREAQNAMLKLFEEPISDTHFFLIVPDINSLLKTLVSRFYLISARQDLAEDLAAETEIQNFLVLPLARRLDFIREKLARFEEKNEGAITDSARADALRFINSLEFALHTSMSRLNLDMEMFEHIFQVRKFLRMPGSSVKNLMESVALIAPVIQ